MCLRRVTSFLRRKKVTNIYRKATVGRVICAPPKRKNHALKILQDQRQRRTTADDSKFRLRPTAPSCRPERIPKPWFWRAFGYFSRAEKVPRRRQNTPIHLPIRAKTQKFPHNKNRTDKSCNSCPSCFQNQKTLQCPPPAIIFSPCPSAGSTALRFSRAAFSEPGRFTSSVPPRVPATARESIACGVICRLA